MRAKAQAVACCLVMLFAACGSSRDSEPVQINDAAVDRFGDRRLTLGLNACEALYTVESIEEAPDEVSILVHRSPRHTEEPEPACEDSFEVDLPSPIAERRLIDASTGEVVPVVVRRVTTE